MKKILVLGVILSAVVSLHAAQVSWQITSIQSLPDGTSAAAGWVAYFMAGDTYDYFSSLTGSAISSYITEGNYKYSTTTQAMRGGIKASADSGSYTAGETISGYIVIFDASDVSTAKHYAITDVTTGQVPASGDFIFSKDFSNDTGGWVAIPEPTSGLLMLLGVAGLALRRKQI